ncbi:transportin-3 [Ostrinia nubilalis]|uniref:transportin-3 n=1 Tax=Ostrinia nubilalis TaxID=29057 RepID=UPI00308244C4
MEAPPMDTVYQAISALYDNPDASEKEKASLWLGDVQKSIHSWKIADDLLHQKKDIQSTYFAAQTMRSKVQNNLSELPPEAIISLRDSLVSHLEGMPPDTSSAILTQLCLALADLALQLPSWENCISELIKTFSNKNDYALLEILTVLPQEIDSSKLKLGENRREDIKQELRSNSQNVNLFLKESIVNSPNTHVGLRIIKCLTSWIQVGAIDMQEIPQNAVIGFCLQVLRDHNSINILHDAACDCVCSLLHWLEDSSHDEVEKLMFDSLSALEDSYHLAVAHEEEEKASNYAKVFTELGETFLTKIIDAVSNGNTHFAMRSLELALVCVGHHDYEVAEVTFNLWYKLSDDVYQRDYQPLTDAFKPHIERLIEGLARHCQCEPDQSTLPDEGDDFFEFRIKVMGLIKDVVFIVGSSAVFRQMFAALHADISWEQTEAALFIMQSVAKNILPEEYEYVPKVVEAILSMPDDTHPGVRKTCILLLGELCEWIEQHPEALEPSLRVLVRAVHDDQLAYAAALALQNICKACRVQAASHAMSLLEATRDSEKLNLPLPAAAALARALASALGGLPPDQLSVAMREAVSMQLAPLQATLKSDAALQKGTSSDPVTSLDKIAALFRDIKAPAPRHDDVALACLPALADAWPVIRDVMQKYNTDGRIMERSTRALRFAVRCVGRNAAALLPPLAVHMASLYMTAAHSCLLYLASVLLDELAAAPGCAPALVQLLQDLMPRAFNLLQVPNGMQDNPDTIDDLFRLCIRFLQRIPLEFLSCGAAGAVVQCANLACKLDHREANSSVMKFLYDFVSAANRGKDQVKVLANELLDLYGAEMTYALLEAAVLHLHAYMLAEVAEVLLELTSARGGAWLQAALGRLPARPAAATPQQCWQFHQYAVRAEKCKEMTRLLRDFARLYR